MTEDSVVFKHNTPLNKNFRTGFFLFLFFFVVINSYAAGYVTLYRRETPEFGNFSPCNC